MDATRYLIVGSSHAALEAVAAIRMHDADGAVTLVSSDRHAPYSPTVLPYVVSGKSAPEKIGLRDADYFAKQNVALRLGVALTGLDPAAREARLADGSSIRFEKALIATGASPAIPAIDGIGTVQYHVLRTLDDALALKAAIGTAKRAVVLGAGLVGMHAAENLVKAGVAVTLVEMSPHLMAGYFDPDAAKLVEAAFTARGTTVLTGCRATAVAPTEGGCRLTLADGRTLDCDLLLVATGVAPNTACLAGSGIDCARGVLVDARMQTSVADVYAAGDCAQAASFFTGQPVLNAILPDAAIQGRIAGAAMAGDDGLKPYVGGVPVNTYHFFDRYAISVGTSAVPEDGSIETRFDQAGGRYLKAIFVQGCLRGIFGIGQFFDAGVMSELIVRCIDLSAVRDRFMDDPRTVGRELMSRLWR